MKISELESALQRIKQAHGDIEVCLWDFEDEFFCVKEKNIYIHKLDDGQNRVSIMVDDMNDMAEKKPISGHRAF